MVKKIARIFSAMLLFVTACALLVSCANTRDRLEIQNVSVPATSQLIIVNVKKTSAAAWQLGSGGKSYGVAFGYSVPLRSLDTMAALARDYNLKRVDGWPIEDLGFYCEVLHVADGESAAAVVARLKQDPRVAQVQMLNHFKTLAAENDPYFRMQFPQQREALANVHQKYSGAGVDVIVIDTGVDIAHPDLKNNIVTARNFVDSDDAGFRRDVHGTAVSGIIGAEANNNIGIVGVAPAARLHVFKACRQPVSEAASHEVQAAAGCNSFGLAKALASAIAAEPDVVNLSLTGPDDELLAMLIAKLSASGALVVAAVDGSRDDGGFPASMPGVIGAFNIKQSGRQALVAPGAEELSTRPSAGYDFFSGSSISSAYVSGVAALMREAYPQTDQATFINWLATDSNVPCPFRELFVASGNANQSCNEH